MGILLDMPPRRVNALAEARRIVGSPHPLDSELMRLIAWSLLKQRRGQRMRQATLPRATPQPTDGCPCLILVQG